MSLLKKQTYIFLQLTIIYFLNYFFNLSLARILSPHEYGEIALILCILTFLVPFALVGSNLAMPRFAAVYLDRKEYSLYYGFRKWSLHLIFTLFALLIIVSTFIVFLSFISERIGLSYLNFYHPFIYSFWLIPLFSFMNYLDENLICLRQEQYGKLSGYYPIICLSLLALGMEFKKTIGQYEIILSLGISMVVILFIQNLLVLKYSPPKIKIKPVLETKIEHEWKKISFELMWNSVLFAGIASIDIFMMQILDIPSNVGKLNVLLTIIYIFIILEEVSYAYNARLISPLVVKGDLIGLQQIYNRAILFKMTCGIVLTSIFILFGKHLLAHFGQAYEMLYPSLVILSLVFTVSLWLASSILLLLFSGHQHILLKIGILQIIIVITLDVLLIPKFHITGAVIGLIVGLILAELLIMYAARVYIKIKVLVWM